MKSEFEKYTQQQLNQHPTDIDLEGLWEAVEPHVRKKKKRRFFWLFFWVLGALTFGSGIYFLNTWNNSESSLLDNFKIEIPQNNANVESAIIEESPASPDKILPANSEKLVSNYLKNQISQTANDQSLNTESLNLGAPKIIENQLKNENLERELFAINAIQFLPISKLNLEKYKESDFPNFNRKDPICPDEFNRWHFGLHTGLSYSFTKLDTFSNAVNDYLQTRKNTEKQLETLHFGTDFQYFLNKKWYVKTGLEYTRIARKMLQNYEQQQYLIIPDTLIAIHINPETQDTIFENGELVLEQMQTFRNRRFSYFHILDVPILAGFQSRKNHWSYGLEAGVLVNIFMKKQGEILDWNNNLYNLKTDDFEWFRNNLGIRGMVKLNIGYHFSPDFQVYCSPSVRFGNRYHLTGNPITQKSVDIGMLAGIRFALR